MAPKGAIYIMQADIDREKILLNKAIHGEPEELLSYLEPMLDEVAIKYSSSDLVKKLGITKEDCKNASKIHFDLAVKKYLGRLQDPIEKKKVFSFVEYFAWYARQGVVEYCHEKMKKEEK
jgi:hypothetical protein